MCTITTTVKASGLIIRCPASGCIRDTRNDVQGRSALHLSDLQDSAVNPVFFRFDVVDRADGQFEQRSACFFVVVVFCSVNNESIQTRCESSGKSVRRLYNSLSSAASIPTGHDTINGGINRLPYNVHRCGREQVVVVD